MTFPRIASVLFLLSIGAGFAKGQSTVQLNAAGENTTKLSYTAQASIGGKLGQIGGRMIDASAKQMADQFFSQLKAQLAPSVMPMTSTKEGKSYSTNPVASSSASSSTQNPSSIPTPNPWQAANAGPIVAPASEGLRVLWFALGAASTAFGAILAVMLSR